MTAPVTPATPAPRSAGAMPVEDRPPVRLRVLADSATMLRRNLRHFLRYPSLTVMLVGQPVLFLLLFVYVFGSTMGRGLPGSDGSRAAYVAYITPAILVMAVASVALGTAVAVATDMTSGIIARFRTMAIARAAVLAGHVLGAMIHSALAVAVSLALAFLVGFRGPASAGEWLAAAGILDLLAFGLTWLTVAMGLASKSVETASNLPMFLLLLPFLGSGFVPAATMPSGLRWFAANQPFTPIMDSVRGLLAGHAAGHDLLLAVIWSIGIAAVGYLWAVRLYRTRDV